MGIGNKMNLIANAQANPQGGGMGAPPVMRSAGGSPPQGQNGQPGVPGAPTGEYYQSGNSNQHTPYGSKPPGADLGQYTAPSFPNQRPDALGSSTIPGQAPSHSSGQGTYPQTGYGVAAKPGYGTGQSGYGAGQSGYGTRQSGYGAGQSGYGAGQSGYGTGQSGYGTGQSGYGTGQSGNGTGQSGYGTGQSGYGTGQSGYGTGQSGNGTGQSGYGAGQSGYGAGQSGYGAAQGTGVPRTGGGKYYQTIYGMLSRLVNEKRWQHFYPQQRLEQLSREISQIDFDYLTQKYKMGSVEVTLELSKIALMDVLLYCDDSGSMKFEDGGDRWYQDLKTIIELSSEICTMFDTDGISLRFFNNPNAKDNICRPEDVKAIINGMEPNGVTPMGEELEKKITRPYLQLLQQSRNNLLSLKPLLVVCITDGVPTDTPKEKTRNVISAARQYLMQSGLVGNEINYQFAQVGRDRNAQKFLDDLDNDPYIGDFIDATSYYEFEEEQWARKGITLTPYLYILKLLLGGFDPEWDSKDE